MKFGIKLAISLVIPLILLTAVFGYLNQQRSRVLLREELAREGRAIALVVQTAAEDYLRDRQLGDLYRLADRITGYERVLGLRLFGPDGTLLYQSASLDSFPFRHWQTLTTVLRTGRPGETRRSFGQRPVVGFIFPLMGSEERLLGAVQVLQLESFMQEDARADRDFIIALSLSMALAVIGIVFFVTRHGVTRPIDELVKSFRAVGTGDLKARVPVRGEDELGRLAQEFNGMCERLETARSSLLDEQERRRRVESRLRGAERLAGLGRLAAGLAHEIGTPLNVISGRAGALQRSLGGNERAERSLQIISDQIDRIVRIVRDMLDFARMKGPRRAPTDLSAVVGTVLDLTESRLEERGIEVELANGAPGPTIMADSDQLQQVFLNLVVNAADAMPEGGRLRIGIASRVLANPERGGPLRECAEVTVEDTGIGMSPETREHAFDPFYTTKQAGEGTGLGLSVSYGIVEEHEGWFDLSSEPGRGTSVRVYLPLRSQHDAVTTPGATA
jgi:two-component system, NtrC family, sensor kinase